MKKMTVAFIAHPLNLSTLSIISGWPLFILNYIGKSRVKRYLEKKKPFIFLKQKNLTSAIGSQIDLMAVACPLLPEQMACLDRDFVLNRIIESVRLAEREGADIAVLGGFTSVIGNEGAEVASAVNIAVTSGNTFTAKLALHGIDVASQIVGLNLGEACCVIIGATGDIGSACARAMASKVKRLILVARNENKLQDFALELARTHTTHVSIALRTSDVVSKADIIISATSALTTLIDSSLLKPGAIVCDVALPANIAREVSRIRKDVLVFEGGLSRVPFNGQIKNSKWDRLVPYNAVYGCLAEGLLLGFEGIKENFSIGRGEIRQEKMDQIWSLALRHGFDLSEFFCGDKFYSAGDITNLRNDVYVDKNVFVDREAINYASNK